MKLAPEVLAELIDIFRQALCEQVDVSDRMRGLDLEPSENPGGPTLKFTAEWVRTHRGGN